MKVERDREQVKGVGRESESNGEIEQLKGEERERERNRADERWGKREREIEQMKGEGREQVKVKREQESRESKIG